MSSAGLADRLRARFGDVVEARGELSIELRAGELLGAMKTLRDEGDLGFAWLSDVAATDWPGREPRFWIAYHLYSPAAGERLRVKVGLPEENPRVPSVTAMFPTADWHEREVYDFFGVIFEGHPDLRRIQLPEEWEGHPLRKDASLGGVDTRYRDGLTIPPPDRRET